MKHTNRFRHRVAGLSALVLIFAAGFTLADDVNMLKVGTASADADRIADVPLMLSSIEDAQGFQMIFEWDGSDATGIDLMPADGAGEALENAELITTRVESSYMILGVVMDIDGQDAEVIPAGQLIPVGLAQIRCDGPSQGSRETPLVLVDEKYARVDGGPLLSNLITQAGETISVDEGLILRDGAITCSGEEPPTTDIIFACGGPLDGDGDPGSQSGARDSEHTVTFYYKSPGDGPGNEDKIQGLSIAVKYHCDLSVDPSTYDQSGGVLDDTEAEFVHLEVDNIAGDDDPCEFTIGVLVDAVAPYDGRTLPSTSTFRKLFSLDFVVEDDADCGECLWIRYFDELNGNGDVYVYNLASVNFYPVTPILQNCEVCVTEGRVKFVRGDCNFSFGGKRAVDISDAAAMVGHFFLQGDAAFDAPCEDACDANDDGDLNAGDIVYILNYLFVPGSPMPPMPFPGPGPDPTDDDLDCAGGEPQC